MFAGACPESVGFPPSKLLYSGDIYPIMLPHSVFTCPGTVASFMVHSALEKGQITLAVTRWLDKPMGPAQIIEIVTREITKSGIQLFDLNDEEVKVSAGDHLPYGIIFEYKLTKIISDLILEVFERQC